MCHPMAFFKCEGGAETQGPRPCLPKLPFLRNMARHGEIFVHPVYGVLYILSSALSSLNEMIG